MTRNPLLKPQWDRPFGLPPFDEISDDDFGPAIDLVLEQARKEFREIADNPDAPNFENTIEALERAQGRIDRIGNVFKVLAEADGNETREALERDLTPKLAALQSDLFIDGPLFRRVRALVDNREMMALSDEQFRVLDLYHREFLRTGAGLPDKARVRVTEIRKRLAELGTAFVQNVLADERNWMMQLSLEEMDGCPDFLKSAAAAASRERGRDGYTITLSRSLVVPFLQYSPRRDLREKAYRAWTARGANGGKTDNRGIIREMLKLREEQARLLAYDSFASYELEPEMAKTPAAARELLMSVWEPAKVAANRDAEKLSEMMHADGICDSLKPWDWHFYSERLRKRKHDFDEAELKPYFQLDRMIEAAFDCANRLFGLTFTPVDVALYHADVRAWDVRKGERHLALFVADYFARSSKRSGAWCTGFRAQSKLDGDVRPIVVNVCNFAKAGEGESTLLTIEEARTLFHEFGHALHVILSNVTYERISGIQVPRDFVELPSQLMENWLFVPEILERYACHADSKKPIPRDLLHRCIAARKFDEGFRSVEYIASALVDLAFHDGTAPADPLESEAAVLEEIGMPDAISMRHASPHFMHVFQELAYASKYYSYMWAEVMEADAFASFEEAGDPFDPEIAARLHDHILSIGGLRDPAALYTAFRGRLPDVEALLKKRGFQLA